MGLTTQCGGRIGLQVSGGANFAVDLTRHIAANAAVRLQLQIWNNDECELTFIALKINLHRAKLMQVDSRQIGALAAINLYVRFDL